ncbi:MAG: hypothetical protein Q9169_004673 [Polycauliona sp. 2 TL-2023]
MSTLQTIRCKISKYEQSLSTKDGSGNAILDAYKKLRFQNHKERVAEYKQQISKHYRAFQVQLQISGLDAAVSDNAKLQARFDTTDSMLSQIVEAVAQRKADKTTKGKPSSSTGTVKGVLISGYVRPALQEVESIASNIPRGAIQAIPVMKTFDEAAQKCKQRCIELALRCSQDNTFYRDTDFEIDVDLDEGRRNCLDNLLIDAQTPSDLSPKSVHRVRDIYLRPIFYKKPSLGAEVKLDHNYSVWWQAGIASAFNIPALIERLCVFQDERGGIYGFLFYRDGEWLPVIIDDNLYLTWSFIQTPIKWRESKGKISQPRLAGSNSLYFGACTDQNETWFPLIEKAYAKAHGDYSALDWGNPGEALEDLMGGVSTQFHLRDIIDRDLFWTQQLKDANNRFLFTVRTKPYADFDDRGWEHNDTIVAPSGTPIIRTYEGYGLRLVLLRSLETLEGSDWKGAWSNASEEWTPEWMKRLDHNFADKQLCWIQYEDLIRKYIYIDRTRLFDRDWTVAQQWVTVEVQRDNDYQETSFDFTLQEKSLVVFCLSQLDTRYYCGLEGLYRFQLHFHVYDDQDDEFIVASRGSYLGSRSVSAEHELSPGKYNVRLQISATKLDSAQSVTDVIAQNSRGRRTKLLQAGAQYDIAHAKALGWRQLRAKQARIEREAVERRRKAKNGKKAKGVRKGKSVQGSEDEHSSDDTDTDNEDLDWNAICAVGLKVFSRDPGLELEVKLSPELKHLLDEDL